MEVIPRLPLNSLRVFEAVARFGSMARAAAALNVQPSAVSMQMKNLAEFVGLPLIAKVGKRVELTSHGQALFPSVLAGLGQIEDTIASLRRAAREQPFTLSVLPAFLHLWLLPRIAAFEAEHPSFRMRILSSRELVDPARGEADAAVRLGAGTWAGLQAKKLMDEGLVPVCAPSLRKRVGRLARGGVPKGVPLLHSAVDPWTRWSTEADKGQQPLIAIDDAIAVVKAAEQGRGVALARTSLVEAAVREGRLVALGAPVAYRWSYYWVTTRAAAQDQRHELMFRWLKAQARSGAFEPV